MKKFIERCAKCHSENIKQQITFMVDPNNVPQELKIDGMECWDDFFWCDDCKSECSTEEHEVQE